MAKRNLDCDWRQYYKDHLISIGEAVDKLQDGDGVYIGQATMIPFSFLDEIYAKMENFKNISFWSNVMSGPINMVFDHNSREHFHLKSIYQLPIERMGIDEHTIEFLGAGYDQYEYCMWENGINTSAITYCPPDENGWCNCGCYGMGTNNTTSRDPRMKKKFAFIDKTGVYPAPGPEDEIYVHVSDFDYIIELDTVMMEIPSPQPTAVDEKIGSFIIPYLRNGDKIQIGYGGLGEVIIKSLNEFPGTFEIFAEVLCDNMVPMVESGKVTSLHASSPGGCSEATFRWLASTDKDVRLYLRTLCVEPLGIMEQENLVAINATFMCDLLGQCCSEAQGLRPYTGMGGSMAYIYGAQRCKGGRSFLCLRSTYKDANGERQSNIVPWLPEGSIVSMLKNYVMFLVSEWGVADVYLKTYQDRIKALIKIAHPDFREWLKEKILTTPLIEEFDFQGYDMFDGKQPEPRQPATCVPFRQYVFPIRDDMEK
ncbi:MAG: hypothetical protein EOM14_01550 [Clostridia bacterium]|nr:hypothetical protein [Clostridia bacterium]